MIARGFAAPQHRLLDWGFPLENGAATAQSTPDAYFACPPAARRHGRSYRRIDSSFVVRRFYLI